MTRRLTVNQSFTGRRQSPVEGPVGQLGASPADPAEASITASLVVVGGTNDGVLFPIPKDGLTLGRLPENDVVIDDPRVSRRHAEIVPDHDSYCLRDLASSNGTFLTDRLIDAADYGLQDGDHIRLGRSDVQLVFRFSATATLNMPSRPGGEESQSPDWSDAPSPPRQAVECHYPAAPGPSDASGPNGVAVREGTPSVGELIGDEVRLNVEAGGDVRLMFQFVHELRQRPELIVLRMSGGPKQDMAVWIELSKPVPLKPLLSRMKFVSKVGRLAKQPIGGPAPIEVFNVCLAI